MRKLATSGYRYLKTAGRALRRFARSGKRLLFRRHKTSILRIGHAPVVSLDGCAAKLRWADDHFRKWDAEVVEPWLRSVDAYAPIADLHTHPGKIIFRLSKDIPDAPSDWALIIGDIVHNMRAALDLLACQLSIANGGPTDCEDTLFPIFDDKTKFGKANWRIKTLHKDDIRTLRDIQPYQRGKHKHSELLWMLHRLDIIDKHRRLHVVGMSSFKNTVLLTEVRAVQAPDLRVSDARKAGDAFVSFTPAQFTYQPPQLNVTPVVTVTFREPGEPFDYTTGLTVRSLLPDISKHIRDDIFPKFAIRVGPLPK